MKTKNIVLAVSMLLSGTVLYGQNDENVYNESVIVVGTFNPEIEESRKKNIAPQISDTVTDMQYDFSYGIAPKRMMSLFKPTRIKAARIIGEPISRLYNSYLKMGMGNYWSPEADFVYNSTRNRDFNYGARLSHRSSWGSIGKKPDWSEGVPCDSLLALYYGKNHYSWTDVNLFGKYIIDDILEINTDMTYNNDYNLLYGFNDSTLRYYMDTTGCSSENFRDSLNKSDYRNMFNYYNWNIGLRSLQTDVNKLGYDANISFYGLSGGYDNGEISVNLDAGAHYGISLGAQNKAIAFLRFGWEGYRQAFRPDTAGFMMPLAYIPVQETYDSVIGYRNMTHLSPSLEFLLKSFHIHAGAKFKFNNFDNPDSVKFQIYPDIVVNKSFMKEAMNVSLGFVGDADTRTLNEIRLINPYIAPNIEYKATSHYDMFAKMRLDFSKKLKMNLSAEYSMIKNDLFFRTSSDYGLGNVMETFYDDLNQATFGASFSFVNDELANISIGGNYYLYDSKKEIVRQSEGEDVMQMPLLYRPNFDAHLDLSFNFKDKVLVKLQGLVLGQMYGDYKLGKIDDIEVLESVDTLPLRYGVNLEVEYRHNKALSFYLKADNIAFQRYMYWLNYPSQRGVFMLGLTYTILNKKSR